MQRPWMENYAKRCVHICHSRGAYAMGGMAALTPGKTKEIRDRQNAKVLEDKKWESGYKGHRFRKIDMDFASFQRALLSAGVKKNEDDD